ncbi:MATE family efflux transporter [Streptomyces sp. NPDC048200]|uniref:MATE family efflux transporter n=1 Tax=Streptomyces sp. NPDC048200 TaxID=3365512 RepID=UPI00371A3CE0
MTAALLALLAGPLVGLFLHDPGTTGTATRALRILVLGLAVAGIAPLVAAFFQATGHPAPAYVISIGAVVLIKMPLTVALARFGTTGVWTAVTAGELVTATLALLLLKHLTAQ